MPSCLPAESIAMPGLFSLLASFNQAADTLPNDTFVLSYRQHNSFHGTLASHPACRSFIDVNYDNISTLRLLKSVAPAAEEAIKRRGVSKFESVEQFAVFCKQCGCVLSDDDRARVAAYANIDV